SVGWTQVTVAVDSGDSRRGGATEEAGPSAPASGGGPESPSAAASDPASPPAGPSSPLSSIRSVAASPASAPSVPPGPRSGANARCRTQENGRTVTLRSTQATRVTTTLPGAHLTHRHAGVKRRRRMLGCWLRSASSPGRQHEVMAPEPGHDRAEKTVAPEGRGERDRHLVRRWTGGAAGKDVHLRHTGRADDQIGESVAIDVACARHPRTEVAPRFESAERHRRLRRRGTAAGPLEDVDSPGDGRPECDVAVAVAVEIAHAGHREGGSA